ncbi:MAG: sigma 54-interacting transcriptional regulator [Planctomycetota bacterium]
MSKQAAGAAGTINDRYRLVRPLSAGPGGAVFLADDLSGGSRPPVVLKILPQQKLDDARNFQALLRVASARHPHLNPVIDFGRVHEAAATGSPAPPFHEGDIFLVTPFRGGGDLDDAVAQLLEPDRAHDLDRFLCGVSLQVLEAVQSLHDNALVHFDIKPEHILMSRAEHPTMRGVPRAYLIDLGLSARDSTPLGNRVRGTFPFIAPEVFESSLVDHRVDLYSFGATLYHALTQRLLVRDRSFEEVEAQLRSSGLPAISDLVPTLSSFWSDLIHRLTHPDPERRYPSASAVISEILAHIESEVTLDLTLDPASFAHTHATALSGQEKEFDYILRELEKLRVGESNYTLMLLGGERGTGKRNVSQRLLTAARLQGITAYRIICRGNWEAPLDPLSRLFRTLLTDPRTPQSLRARLERLIRAIFDGDTPYQGEELAEVQEARYRLSAEVSAVFTELEATGAFLFIFEGLERAAPELLEHLGNAAHRVWLRRRIDRGAESPLWQELTPIEEQIGHAIGPVAEVGSRNVLILGVVDEPTPQITTDLPGRLLTIDQLAAEEFSARVTLQPLSTARAKDLIVDCLGAGGLPARIPEELHRIAHGHAGALSRLIDESRHRGLLTRQARGWVWNVDADNFAAELQAKRTAEWDRLDESKKATLQALAHCGGTLPANLLELLLLELDIAEDEERLGDLENSGWIYRELGLVTDLIRLQTTLPDEDPASGACTLATVMRAHANLDRQRRPGNPIAASRQLLAAAAFDELIDTVPRSIEVLQQLHCELSLLGLLENLRESHPDIVEPEWLVAQAECLAAQNNLEMAIAVLEGALAAGPSPATRVAALQKLAQYSTDTQQQQIWLTEAMDAARSIGDRELLVACALQTADYHLNAGEHAAALQWVSVADAQLAADGSVTTITDSTLEARIHLFEAKVHAAQNFSERAKSVITACLEKRGDEIPAAWRSQLLHALAEIELTHSRYEKAEEYLAETLRIDCAQGNLFSAAQTLGSLGRIYVSRAEREHAGHYHQRSLRLRREIRDLQGIAGSENNIGLVHKIMNRTDEGEACFRKAAEIFETLGLTNSQAAALNNLSDTMLSRGDYGLALKYAFQGLEMRKTVGNASGVAFSYYRIASIYKDQGELDRAADYAEKSLEIRRELGDKLDLAYSLVLLGELHLIRARYFPAFRCLRQSLSNFEALGDRFGRQTLLAFLGEVFRRLGHYDEARDYIDRSLAIAKEHNVDYYIAVSLRALGNLLLDLGDLSGAEEMLTRAEQLFRNQGSRRDLTHVLLGRTRVAMELGDPEQGLARLAEAYSYIEEVGLQAQSPTYYRLRGTIASSGENADLGVARKLLERGLAEARNLNLPEETWRLQYQLAHVARREDRPEDAEQLIRQAIDIVQTIHDELPTQFQEAYLAVQARADLLSESDASREAEPLLPSADAPPVVEPTAPTATTHQPQRTDSGPSDGDLLRLQKISVLLSSERDLNTLLNRIMDEVVNLFVAERGFLILFDGDQPTIEAARNIDREEIERPEFKYSHSIAREVAVTGTLFVTNDAQKDSRLREAHSVHDLRLQAIACFPLIWRGERLGVIYLENRFRKQILEPQQYPLVEAFSSQCAVALVNARLHEQSERRRLELEESQRRVEELNRRLELRVEEQSRALEAAEREIQLKQGQLEDRFRFHNIIGESPQMQALYRVLDRVSQTELPVLIEGESGTGKELVANAIHYNSRRRKESFVTENCGAVAESLFESELFGHARGAFTGADQDRDGLIAIAEGGTLFLDEVHELSLDVQKKLLRFLQEGVYRPVGSKEFRTANVRILSAANRPLLQLVQQKKFREDLYYRLNVLKVELPPLRDRGKDILLLARHFLEQVVASEELGERNFSEGCLRLLSSYAYPGNVRELRNVVEKAAILSAGPVMQPNELVFDQPVETIVTAPDNASWQQMPLREAKEEFQREYLSTLLARCDGVVSRAARESGITRESFHRLMKKFGIQR